MNSARVVVFGATGFIGSHLLASLPPTETRVVVRKPLHGWRGEQIQAADLAAEFDIRPLIEGCDAVINLAGHAHTSAEANPLHKSKCYKINAEFPGRLAAACQDLNVSHLIHVSSLHAVATESDEVLNELTPPCPKSAYGASKLAGEAALQAALASRKTSWTILRPPLVYGARNPANMSKVIRIVRGNIPLPVARVKNLRSFIYVRNFVDVILRCLDHPAAANQILHVSDDHDVSTADLVRMIAQALGKRAILLPVPEIVLDLVQAFPGGAALHKLRASLATSIGLLKSRLDWNPPFSMEKGLAETTTAFMRRFPS